MDDGGGIVNNIRVSPPIECISDFVAYIPCYEGGNSVMAVEKDGQTVLINKSIRSVIKNLSKESSINMGFIRKNFRDVMGCTNLMPLPVKLGTMLVPFKVRKTIAINDGSFAYIDLSSIKDVTGDKHTAIKLKCGVEIKCLESARTVSNRISKSRILEGKFAAALLGECSLSERTPHQVESEKAATKGDITMLAYEIMKLRSRLE